MNISKFKFIINFKVFALLILFSSPGYALAESQADLLGLDESAGKALMSQILVETKALKVNFDTIYGYNSAINMYFVNSENCPTLYNLVQAFVVKTGLPENFNWICIGFGEVATGCQVEMHSALDGVLAGTGLTIGYEILEKVTYNELIAVLAHEIGHAKLKHIKTNLKIQLAVEGIRLGLSYAYAAYNNVYTDTTVWGNVKNHFKFTYFSVKGLTANVSLAIAQGYLMSYLSRRNEYQADRFSCETVNQPDALITGIEKIETLNAIKHPISMKIAKIQMAIGLGSHPKTASRAAYLAKLVNQKKLNQLVTVS